METLVVVKQFPTLFFENLDLLIKSYYLKQFFFFFKRMISQYGFSINCTLGKLLLLKTIVNWVLELGLNCCISAPTGT